MVSLRQEFFISTQKWFPPLNDFHEEKTLLYVKESEKVLEGGPDMRVATGCPVPSQALPVPRLLQASWGMSEGYFYPYL